MPYVPAGAPGMKDPVPSFFHVVVALLCLALLNIGIAWVLYSPLFHFFEWFNHISLFWKWIILFPGGYMFFKTEIWLTSKVAAFLGMLVYAIFPIIRFTMKAAVTRRITSKDSLC